MILVGPEGAAQNRVLSESQGALAWAFPVGEQRASCVLAFFWPQVLALCAHPRARKDNSVAKGEGLWEGRGLGLNFKPKGEL